MRYFNFHKRSGFTLVEIVVTASIIVVLATAIIVQVRNVSPNQELENATDILRSYLSELRTKSLAGQNCCGGVTPMGYLVRIPTNQPGGLMLQYAAIEQSDMAYTEGQDIITQSVPLPNNVQLVSCADATRTYTAGDCYVGVRSLAYPDTGDCGTDCGNDMVGFNDDSAVGVVTFTLQHIGTGTTSTVGINSITMVVQ